MDISTTAMTATGLAIGPALGKLLSFWLFRRRSSKAIAAYALRRLA